MEHEFWYPARFASNPILRVADTSCCMRLPVIPALAQAQIRSGFDPSQKIQKSRNQTAIVSVNGIGLLPARIAETAYLKPAR
jgi:hypothetical protein